ncbi:MAG: nucleoside triphosphate pyrophosphohydrolase [Candidatus Nanohaloarchaea archaeon]
MTDDLPKLVRDRIPEIIEEDGEEPVTEEVEGEELEQRLADKLVEEAEEFQESREREELADVLEVVDRLLEFLDDVRELKGLQEQKRKERGGFEDNLVLKETVEQDGGGPR